MTEQIPELIRAVRDYVASGVIWILTVWTIFSSSFGHKTHQGDSLASVFKPLIPAIQNVSSLLALCAIAAVLGSVSVQVFRAPAIWICNISVAAVKMVEQLLIAITAKYRHESTIRRFRDRETIPVDIARRYVSNRKADIDAAATAASVDAERLCEIVYHEADKEHWKFTRSPAPPNATIIEFHGQSIFRLCLVVPLLCLSFALAIKISPGYLILSVAPLIIAFQASDYRHERDQLLYEEFNKSISFDELAKRL